MSSPSDAASLTTALADCAGSRYNVTWNGAVTLSEPLVVAAGSSLIIRGAVGAAGDGAALDGNNATGLVDLGRGSSLRLEGVTLRNARRITGNGGAVNAEAEGCSVTAVNTGFEDNVMEAETFGEGRGGAMALGSGGTVELEDCRVERNFAQGSGGGISALGNGCSVVMRRCVFDENASENYGGAVQVYGRSTAAFEGCTMTNNYAVDEGGAVYGVNATVEVSAGSMFVNNSAVYGGGGVSVRVSARSWVSFSGEGVTYGNCFFCSFVT